MSKSESPAARRGARAVNPIALRITDPLLAQRVIALADEHNLSLNMAVNMLLGFAFNEVDKQGKTFKSRIVFEADEADTDSV